MKKKKGILILGCTAAVLVLGVAAAASAKAYVNTYFVRGTQVNGIDVSGERVDSLKETVENYVLEITERETDGERTFTETIRGDEIGLEIRSDAPLYKILEEQSVWSLLTGANENYELADGLSYDETALRRKVEALKCLDEEYTADPVNAGAAKYDSQTKTYQVTPEQPGNTLDATLAYEAVEQAVLRLDDTLDMAEADCYVKPEITENSEEIQAITDQLNRYVQTEITYTFGDETEVLDGDTIHKWLKVDAQGKVTIKKKKISNYVAKLRRKYDTIFHNRDFQTAYGTTVRVEGGDYGWWMNYQKEEEKLLKLIKKGKKTKRTPEYYQTAAAYGEKDYGDTYVEVDLTGQRVFVVQEGKTVLETECVTGNASKGHATPQGTYSITYKQRDATLKGENYTTPVDYWMPFNGGIGLHDADWRSSFGGSIYKYSGSHGCVNLPPSMAAKIFQMVDKGTPVICYYSDHTVQKKNTSSQKKSAKLQATEKPGMTTAPKATVKPKATATPKVTAPPHKKAKVTSTPKVKKKAKVTATPKKKKKEKVTATPKVKKKAKAKATVAPKKKKKAKITATPKGKKKAKVKATVKPKKKKKAKVTATPKVKKKAKAKATVKPKK